MSLSRLWRNRRGVAAVEFAILAPVLIPMYMIGVDVVMLMRNRFRVDQSAAQVMQIVSQYTDLYDSDFTGVFFPIAQTIAGNNAALATPAACTVVVSGLDVADRTALIPKFVVKWQRSTGTCATSKVGLPSASPTLQGGYTPPIGVPLIVVEVVSQRTLFGPSAALLGKTQQQYSVAVAMPRTRSLPSLTASAAAPPSVRP